MNQDSPTGRQLLERAAQQLLDPQGRDLAAAVQWWALPNLGDDWPVAVMGSASGSEPVLLLHGFDSSCLEFRRLAPLLTPQATVLVPDLYGFGFSPRPTQGEVTPTGVLQHLELLLEAACERLGVSRHG